MSKKNNISHEQILKSCELVDLFMQHSTVDCYSPPPYINELFDEKKENFEHKLSSDYDSFQGGFLCSLTSVYSILEKTENKRKEKELLFVRCCFSAIYFLKKKFKSIELEGSGIKAFSEKTAAFNIYPFVREYTYSSLQRIGIHHNIPLPLFLKGKVVKEKKNHLSKKTSIS